MAFQGQQQSTCTRDEGAASPVRDQQSVRPHDGDLLKSLSAVYEQGVASNHGRSGR